jgi:hypothetical protein
MKRNWYLSSSNLRICLALFGWGGYRASAPVAQFQWVELQGTWYLYNSRSHIILATARRANAQLLIRYRTKSRYRYIIQAWAERQDCVALPSDHVGRWERRMRYLRVQGVGSRPTALARYFQYQGSIPELVRDSLGSYHTRRVTVTPPEVAELDTFVSNQTFYTSSMTNDLISRLRQQ